MIAVAVDEEMTLGADAADAFRKKGLEFERRFPRCDVNAIGVGSLAASAELAVLESVLGEAHDRVTPTPDMLTGLKTTNAAEFAVKALLEVALAHDLQIVFID